MSSSHAVAHARGCGASSQVGLQPAVRPAQDVPWAAGGGTSSDLGHGSRLTVFRDRRFTGGRRAGVVVHVAQAARCGSRGGPDEAAAALARHLAGVNCRPGAQGPEGVRVSVISPRRSVTDRSAQRPRPQARRGKDRSWL